MTRQSLSAWCLVIGAAWLAPAGAAGQTQAAAPDGWTASRTAWGDPDLQGVWSFATITPLERPERYAGRDRLTDTEITTLNQDALTRGDEPPPPGDTGAYNAFWFDRGESTGQTSLIVDPPDGRIPFTPEGRARLEARRAPSPRWRSVRATCCRTTTTSASTPTNRPSSRTARSRTPSTSWWADSTSPS